MKRILMLAAVAALMLAVLPIAGAGANGVVNGTYDLYAGQDILVG